MHRDKIKGLSVVFPFFALQAKLFQTATEIAVSGVAAATSLASASLHAMASATTQTAKTAGSDPSSTLNFPASFASGSGLPMFEPFANLTALAEGPMALPFQVQPWSFEGSTWLRAKTLSWPAPWWPAPSHMPLAFFPNLFERRRTALEQIADPFDLWARTGTSMPGFLPSLPPSFDGLSRIMPSAQSLKTVQALILAWSGPLLAQSPGTFPRPFFGL